MVMVDWLCEKVGIIALVMDVVSNYYELVQYLE